MRHSLCQAFYIGTPNSPSPYIIMTTIYFYIAILLTFLLLLLTKRKNACISCFNGFFAVASPGNLLTSRRNRWTYVLAFGITLETIANIIFQPDLVPLAYPLAYVDWGSFGMGWILRKIVAINFCMIYYYPMFVSVTMQTFWGFVIGFVQIVFLMVIKLYSLAACASDANLVVLILVGLVTLVCQTMMIVYLLVKIVYFFKKENSTRNWIKTEYEASYILHEDYPRIHVESLLTKKDNRNERIIAKIYKVKSGFLYSGRVITSSVLAVAIIYQITVIIVAETIPDMIASANNFGEESGAMFALITLLFTVFTGKQPADEDSGTLLDLVQDFYDGAWISLVVCTVVCLCFALFNALFQILVYRRDIRALYRLVLQKITRMTRWHKMMTFLTQKCIRFTGMSCPLSLSFCPCPVLLSLGNHSRDNLGTTFQ